MAEIAVSLKGLPAEGLRSFWGERTGWCTWLSILNAEVVQSTTFSIGVFHDG